MSKARLSRKRVVLRRAAKRRARYDGSDAGFENVERPAYLLWRADGGSAAKIEISPSEEADRVEVQV